MEVNKAQKYLFCLTGVAIFVLFAVFKYGGQLYLETENRNFEKNRVKSELDCNVVPVHCAIRDDDLFELQDLIADGIDLEARDNWGATALFWAAMRDEFAYIEVLLVGGSNPNTKDGSGSVLISRCVQSGKFEIAELLLKYGANIEEEGGLGGVSLTPVQHTIKNGDMEGRDWLAIHGAKIP